ncbi:hypothetical protein P5673_032553 [Acropora cervicornis]|uniref:Uncharacterized protein n=1 Tax=Acropora cervicornis TaxID=6130 RepID=A0AAD9URQ0_ACRCE|nr:hypothetical protein P5673_032553 [Acropora cervicornis]
MFSATDVAGAFYEMSFDSLTRKLRDQMNKWFDMLFGRTKKYHQIGIQWTRQSEFGMTEQVLPKPWPSMGVLVSIKCKLDVFYAGASDNQLVLSLLDVVITLDSNADVMAFFKLLLIITPRRPHISRRLLLSRIANHRIGKQGEHFNLRFDVVDFHFVGVRVILNDGDVAYVSKSLNFTFYRLGLADVRNITVVQNDSDTYKVKVYNVESQIEMFPLIPDSVICDPGQQKPTGDMWTPWCDNQQKFEEGHYIGITLSKKKEDDHVYQLFQSGQNVYKTVNMDYSLRAHIQGDYNIKKGEYKLIITGSSVEDVKFTFDRY